MTYIAKVVADSESPHGIRLTTFELTYPLLIHNQLMTHRAFSRCTASSRAIPVQKMIDSVMDNPFVPERWPMNQKGMQPLECLDGVMSLPLRDRWLRARDAAVEETREMMQMGVHKQIANRLLAPFLWTTAVVSATEWANFANLRVDSHAQDEFFKLARMVLRAYFRSRPRQAAPGEWHLPYISNEMRDRYSSVPGYSVTEDMPEVPYLAMVSVGLCAGISYLRPTEGYVIGDKYQLAIRLSQDAHWSPFEHVAKCLDTPFPSRACGNFMQGWAQLRKMFGGENQNAFRIEHLAAHGIHQIHGEWVVTGED
jgi:thymidylate synthase ThyX